MNLRNDGGNFSAATGAGAPKPSAFCRALVACLLVAVCIIATGTTGFSQSPSPTPAKESAAVSNDNVSVGQTEDHTVEPSSPKNDDKGKQKGEKRGSFIIAPIPISSPAFGSGLLLITAYVFKFDKNDDVSPPSWGGVAGAFTNNGSRGLATGAKLYLKENKYQTTIAAMKGRAHLDFFGIGRIPGRAPISEKSR